MITQDSILFGTTKISYAVSYSGRRKNATLAVYPLKYVEIKVPTSTEPEDIQRIVRKKAAWVLKQIVWFDQLARMDSAKEYVNGETYLYLGRQYQLKISKGNGKAETSLNGKHLQVILPQNARGEDAKKTVKAAVWCWYREQAKKKIGESLSHYSRKLGTEPPEFRIKNQSKRWGSCTSKNMLIFNFRIAMAPASQLNYVVAHELCHAKFKDHSPKFWKLLRSIMPECEERKEKLRQDGWQYVL